MARLATIPEQLAVAEAGPSLEVTRDDLVVAMAKLWLMRRVERLESPERLEDWRQRRL